MFCLFPLLNKIYSGAVFLWLLTQSFCCQLLRCRFESETVAPDQKIFDSWWCPLAKFHTPLLSEGALRYCAETFWHEFLDSMCLTVTKFHIAVMKASLSQRSKILTNFTPLPEGDALLFRWNQSQSFLICIVLIIQCPTCLLFATGHADSVTQWIIALPGFKRLLTAHVFVKEPLNTDILFRYIVQW